MKYAGIGSRETPDHVQEEFVSLAFAYAKNNWMLRSGGARGADQAFERGCDKANGVKEIFLAVNCTPEAMEFSSQYHPAWNRCSPYARKLHGRNAMILLGENLDDPVELVICWTLGGKMVGGTAQALRIAKVLDIQIENFGST